MIKKVEELKQPEVIKIGPLMYSIFWDEQKIKEFSYADGTKVRGYCDQEAMEIVIDPKLNVQMKRETLWHEIKHACAYWVYTTLTNPSEEEVISLTAPIELAVLRDNRDLTDWLVVA